MKDSKLIQIGEKSYKQCEVIMLPTKEQRWNNGHDDRYECYSFVDKKLYSRQSNAYNWSLSHLYILSSEEIKKGDWCIDDNNYIFKMTAEFIKNNTHHNWQEYYKKIIATTDYSIGGYDILDTGEQTNYNLPRPSDDFIKAFVEKQGKIDKVLVEVICNKLSQCNCTDNYSCLGTKFKVAPDNTITIKPIQEEKAFWSREEVLKALNNPYGQGSINRDEYRQRVLFDLGLN